MLVVTGKYKLHVTDDGRILKCTASVKDCVYSNSADGNRHFDANDMESASRKSAEILNKKYNKFSVHKKPGKISDRIKNGQNLGGASLNLDNLKNRKIRDMSLNPVDLSDEFFSEFNKLTKKVS